MELLASQQDQYIILEHSLKEMIYRLGYFSELSVVAIDSLFRSCLIHKCAILYSNYYICIWLFFQDNDKAHISLDQPSHTAKEGLSPLQLGNVYSHSSTSCKYSINFSPKNPQIILYRL